MRYHFVSLLYFAALKLSYSWQTRVVPTRRQSHWSSSTRLDFSMMDIHVDTMTALTTSLVVGGTLFLTDQMASQVRKQNVLAFNEKKKQQAMMVESKDKETRIATVIKEETHTTEKEKSKTKVNVVSYASALEGSPVVQSEAVSIEIQSDAKAPDAIAVLEAPVETTDNKQSSDSNFSKRKDSDNELAVEVPTKVDEQESSPAEKTSAKPSFISYLESSSENGAQEEATSLGEKNEVDLVTSLAPRDMVRPAAYDIDEQSSDGKDQVLSSKNQFQANTSISWPSATVKEASNAVEATISGSTSGGGSVEGTAKPKEELSTVSTPIFAMNTSVSNPRIVAKDTLNRKEPESINELNPVKETFSEQKKAPVLPRTETPQVDFTHSRPQSTPDILKEISKPTSNTVVQGKSRLVAKSTTTTATQQKSFRDDATKTSLRSSLSLLANAAEPKDLDEEDTAFISLQQYIQDQARDMTLKRMGGKIDWLSTENEEEPLLQPAVATEETKVLDGNVLSLADSSESLFNADLPIFFAPVVDDPYAETKQTKFASASIVSTETTSENTATAVSTPESDEEVAKSLRKSSNPSLIKKARQSALLVAVATGIVVLGKRLATVALGRAML